MARTKKTETSVKTDKELQSVIDSIEKDFGLGSIMYLGDRPKRKISVVNTGSIGLNKALGIGGVPKGRVIEIYGPESSGKTTLATHIIAEAQKVGGKCAFIDAEHAFDSNYASQLGVDVDNLLISQPDYGEQALEITDRLVNSGKINVIVVDSVAALVPKNELDGEMGDTKMGLHARLMSQALRKLTAKVSKTGTILIFINQLRDKIGVMFGSPETTSGGNALKFYSSIRLDVRRLNSIKDGDEIVANRVKVKVAKNKLAPPFKLTEFDIRFGEGIDKYSELLDIASELNIINKSGSWFSYNNEKLGQGKESVRNLLKDNEGLFLEIKNNIQKLLFI